MVGFYDAVICSTIKQEEGFKDYRFIAERTANEVGYNVLRNSEHGGSTQRKFDNCLRESYPIFIALIGETLTENVLTEYKTALEIGLPILTFIKTNADQVISANVKGNLCRISKYIYEKDCCAFYDCESLYNALKSRLTDYKETVKNRKIEFLQNREDIYPFTADMICQAKSLVVLCQNTSTLLLGARANKVESKCYTQLIDWIRSADEKMEFIHIFSKGKTLSELQNKEYANIKTAKENLISLINDTNVKANILLRTVESLQPCVISDHDILFSLSLGTNVHYIKLPSAFISCQHANAIINSLSISGELFCSNRSDEPEMNIENLNNFYIC